LRVFSVRQAGKKAGARRSDLYAECDCVKCGSYVRVLKSNLLSGKTVQCKRCNVKAGHECTARELWGGRVPDEIDRKLRDRWIGIKARCENPDSHEFHRYGGRGITLSDEFQDPLIFIDYVKGLPNMSLDLQLDRIDNNKGYERGNLRWVTSRVNCSNREISRKVSYNGVEMPLSDFVRDFTDMSYAYVNTLIKSGVTAEEIVNWKREITLVTYNGETLSLLAFAKKYSGKSYPLVCRLHRLGLSPEEIVAWEKKKPKEVVYDGKTMSLENFFRDYTELSSRYARKLYDSGIPLTKIATWEKKQHVVTYSGRKMYFTDFVRDFTALSYPYACKLYREGRSPEEIASWKKKGSCV